MSNPPGAAVTQPSVAAPPRRRSGLKILTTLVVVLLMGSVVANVIMVLLVMVMGSSIGGSDESPAHRVQKELVTKGGPDKIAIMPVSGPVDEAMYERLHNFCEYIKEDNSIKAVILEVDSPGGTVTASDEIYHLLLTLKGTNRNLVVSMRGLAASGGYYLSMAADKLYAEPTTLTGSIGVIWPSFEVTELMQKWGVQSEVIKSDAANDYKDAGSPFKKFTEKDREYIKGLVNSAHTKFASIVAAGRKGKLTVPVDQVAIGKIWTADDAKKLGLIDDIAYMDEVCERTARDAGLSNPTIIRLKERAGLFDLLSASSPVGGGKVEVKIDPKALEELTRGRLEYRYQGIR